jgi:hypothetical protein
MRLWDKKHLSIKVFPISFLYSKIWVEPRGLQISKYVYELVSERLNMLNLVPVNKYFKNKLKTKEYILFRIDTVPSPWENIYPYKDFDIDKPDFKSITDTVVIDLYIHFVELDTINYTQKVLNNLEMAIVEGLTSLGIYGEYISQTFNEIKNEVKVNNKYWYFVYKG